MIDLFLGLSFGLLWCWLLNTLKLRGNPFLMNPIKEYKKAKFAFIFCMILGWLLVKLIFSIGFGILISWYYIVGFLVAAILYCEFAKVKKRETK